MKSYEISEELAARWADQAEAGIDLDNATSRPGPYAWMLDVITDWDAFAAQVKAENTTPEDLIARAIDSYIHQNQAA